jgi:hypothetical protein
MTPQGWIVQPGTDGALSVISLQPSADSAVGFLASAGPVADLFSDLDPVSLESMAEQIRSSVANESTIFAEPRPVQIGGNDGLLLEFRDQEALGMAAIALLGEDRAFAMLGIGGGDVWEPAQFEAIVSTVEFSTSPLSAGTTGESPATTAAATTVAPAVAERAQVIAVGASANTISMLQDGNWSSPAQHELGSCVHGGDTFTAADGTLYVACNNLFRFDQSTATWQAVPLVESGDFALFDRIVQDPQGDIWAISSEQILVFDPISNRAIGRYTPQEAVGEQAFPTDGAAFASDGTLYLGGFNLGGSALLSFDGERWTAHGTPEDMGVESFAHPNALLVDSAGRVVVASAGVVYTFDDGRLRELVPSSLSVPTDIRELLELPNGELWMASSNGIAVWDGSAVRTIGREQGLLSLAINDLALDASGRVWAATDYGLAVQQGDTWQVALPSTSDISESRIAALLVRGTPELPAASAERGATLSGRLTLNGAPVADAQVQLCSEGGSLVAAVSPCEDLPINTIVTTDSEGRFRFVNVPLGTMSVAAFNPTADGWVIFLGGVDLLQPNQEIDIGDLELGD